MADRPRSARRLWLLALLTLAGMVSLLADLFALGPLAQPSLPAPRAPRTIPNTDLDPFGVNIFLDREVAEWKIRRAIEMIDQAGVDWVKQQFSWAEIEQDGPGDFWDDQYGKSSWAKFDRIVDLAQEYGLQVIARVDRPPAWARVADNPEAPPADPHTYAAFIKAFVEHYKGRIHYLQVWNEPNLDTEWVYGAAVDPHGYVTLLRLAYQAAKEVDPNIQILSAPLAMKDIDEPDRHSVSDLTFLEEMYRAGAAPYFDIMSANAYGINSPPDEPPAASQYNFRRVELLRQAMERNGDTNKAIWFNEYGWNVAPAGIVAPWGRVSDEQQAQWTVEGIAYAQEHWPWAGVLAIWYFRQGGEYPPGSAAYYFRMVNVDFTPMPVYRSVQRAATALSTAYPGSYEETAAPIQRRGDWQPVYTSTASAGEYLSANDPSSRMEVTFVGSDLTVRVRRGPDAGRLLVWVDGVAGRGTALPEDTQGRAYLDLYSPQDEWVSVRLVQGLGQQLPARAHRLEMSVAEEKDPRSEGHACAVDVLEVQYHHSDVLFWTTAGLLAAATAGAAAALVLEFRRPRLPQLRRAPVNPWTVRPEQVSSEDDDSGQTLPD